MKQLKNFLFEYKTFNTVRLYNIRKQSYVIKNNSFSSKAQKNLICHNYSSPPIFTGRYAFEQAGEALLKNRRNIVCNLTSDSPQSS